MGIWHWVRKCVDDVWMLQDLYGVSWGGDRRLSRVTMMWHCDVTQNVTPDTVMVHGHCEMRGDHPHSGVIITTYTSYTATWHERQSEDGVLDLKAGCSVVIKAHMNMSSLPGSFKHHLLHDIQYTDTQHSLLQSRPWFFCRWAKFKLGVGLVRWEMSFLTHHDIICKTHSPMSLFANIRRIGDQEWLLGIAFQFCYRCIKESPFFI